MTSPPEHLSPLPTYMSNAQLMDAILDGISGKQKSLARWAAAELLKRAAQNQETKADA